MWDSPLMTPQGHRDIILPPCRGGAYTSAVAVAGISPSQDSSTPADRFVSSRALRNRNREASRTSLVSAVPQNVRGVGAGNGRNAFAHLPRSVSAMSCPWAIFTNKACGGLALGWPCQRKVASNHSSGEICFVRLLHFFWLCDAFPPRKAPPECRVSPAMYPFLMGRAAVVVGPQTHTCALARYRV
ncbi:hypothetical protein VTK26DRAFT_767 [Humicola hyalothermophila]